MGTWPGRLYHHYTWARRSAARSELSQQASPARTVPVREASGLLMAGDGVANSTIAEALGVWRSTNLQWRSHFEPAGSIGLARCTKAAAAKPVVVQERIDPMISDTLHMTAPDATQLIASHDGRSLRAHTRQSSASGRPVEPESYLGQDVSNDPESEDSSHRGLRRPSHEDPLPFTW